MEKFKMFKKIFMISLMLINFSIGQELDWQTYKNKYLKDGSYIIDPYNENRVTSEAQGYGMLLSVLYKDKETFDKLWKWTKNTLQREDNLFAWHWNKEIKDINNATDGDILIAYSLKKAYEIWRDNNYKQEYEKILNSLSRLVVIIKDNKYNDNYLLLPATYGFTNENYDIFIFPSYYINFALKEFGKKSKLWNNTYYYFINHLVGGKLTTNLKFNLIEKKVSLVNPANLDVYRVIAYTYISGDDLSGLKKSFSEIDNFFKEKGYIPFNYNFGVDNQESREAPFCVYRFFYILYSDQKYSERYKVLKEVDKNNYFCDTFELLLNFRLD
ncbi:glycosyl hydrolase family 8 [Sulfurihydrogenibium sp.]|uniref:glycosyl hydrolase family 8 n=1 Tax=Sulfurihydrogenibium sp. TaxID=2053621 RepID=UPI003D10E12B